MSSDRIVLLLQRMRQAAFEAHGFVVGVDKTFFLQNLILQRAVGMSLLMSSECAAQLMDKHPEFVSDHPEFPWVLIRGMRNRMANGYFDINLERVWDTATMEAPDFVEKLDAILEWRAEGE